MEFFTSIKDFFISTHVPEQVKDVDIVGLFSNPWFIIPFVLMVGYMLFKQSWKDLIIIAIFVGIWWVTGTNYMDNLLVNGEISMEKILPVIFGGAVVLGFVVYLFFGRSD